MITILFDLETRTARLALTTVLKTKADVQVRVQFPAAPGSVDALEFRLGTLVNAPTELAKAITFTAENQRLFVDTLDTGDTRLVAAVSGPTAVAGQLSMVLDGESIVLPNLNLTVQPSFAVPA
jgi:hypothetical protein